MADSDKPIFFYATGTAFSPTIIWEDGKLRTGYNVIGIDEPSLTVAGLNGKTAPFTGGVTNDPFPALMNTDLWEVVKVPYPASAFPMDNSIHQGKMWIIDAVNDLKSGRPWAMGGTSQGGAVCSEVYKVMQDGDLINTSQRNSFLTGVCFGNPMRQVNYTNPWSSYSGAFDVPGSTTGGHGSFPIGYRLSDCDQSNWIEFTNPFENISGVGDSPVGHWWQASNGAFLLQTAVTPGAPGSFLFNLAEFLLGVGADLLSQGLPFVPEFFGSINKCTDPNDPEYIGPGPTTDAAGKVVQLLGGGHVLYPFTPPVGHTGPETAYQLALKYLEDIAKEYVVSSSVLPPVSSVAGWSTSIRPPAS